MNITLTWSDVKLDITYEKISGGSTGEFYDGDEIDITEICTHNGDWDILPIINRIPNAINEIENIIMDGR